MIYRPKSYCLEETSLTVTIATILSNVVVVVSSSSKYHGFGHFCIPITKQYKIWFNISRDLQFPARYCKCATKSFIDSLLHNKHCYNLILIANWPITHTLASLPSGVQLPHYNNTLWREIYHRNRRRSQCGCLRFIHGRQRHRGGVQWLTAGYVKWLSHVLLKINDVVFKTFLLTILQTLSILWGHYTNDII